MCVLEDLLAVSCLVDFQEDSDAEFCDVVDADDLKRMEMEMKGFYSIKVEKWTDRILRTFLG